MGAMMANDLAESGLDLEASIGIHLRSNHFPPVPLKMVPTCVEAIDAVNTEGDWGMLIYLPDGVTRLGADFATAQEIIEQHNLGFWIVESELD